MFPLMNMLLKMSSAQSQSFRLGLNAAYSHMKNFYFENNLKKLTNENQYFSKSTEVLKY